MRRSEQVSIALLGLILLLGGFDLFFGLRVYHLQQGLDMVHHSPQQQAMRGEPRHLPRAGAEGSTGNDILAAPEVTTVSGREAHLKAPSVQVNSLPVLQVDSAPLLHR